MFSLQKKRKKQNHFSVKTLYPGQLFGALKLNSFITASKESVGPSSALSFNDSSNNFNDSSHFPLI